MLPREPPRQKARRLTPGLVALLVLATAPLLDAQPTGTDQWVEYAGTSGPGAGKHIVLISGDEEYRSEEAMPMLGKLLAEHHGFRCTVLFAIDRENGRINPDEQTNIPGLEALDGADLMILFTRFRELPDGHMKHIVDYVESGGQILGLRTSTHAFHYTRNPESPYAHYGFRDQGWAGGFGQQVLGDTWINHHGHHKRESTRGVENPEHSDHPILRGVDDVWGPTDVYGIKNLPSTASVLLWGQVLSGMKPDDPPLEGPKNDPMIPLAWTLSYTGKQGETSRVFTTTMGASVDLRNEGLRRLLVNAAYWSLGMEDEISADSDVSIVGKYQPTFFGFGEFRKGMRPSDFR